MSRVRGSFVTALVLVASALTGTCALAQAYPVKPVKIVVPFPPGGPTDIIGRLVAAKLSEGLGQQFIVDNRPGAGGTIGSDTVARAPADGYTLLYGSTSTLAMAPSLYRNLPYDPRKSFAPISLVSSGPLLIAVNAQVPATTLKTFTDLAKGKPGGFNYASAGNGTPPHLAAELFKSIAGVELTHVPYKGGGPALQGVLANDAQVIFEGVVTLQPHIKSGKLRALAITRTERHPALPDVPTVAEAGLPAFQVAFWSGLVAPAGTPPEILARLNDALRKALATTEVRDLLAREGLQSGGDTPAEFASFIASEISRWEKVVKASGAKLD